MENEKDRHGDIGVESPWGFWGAGAGEGRYESPDIITLIDDCCSRSMMDRFIDSVKACTDILDISDNT